MTKIAGEQFASQLGKLFESIKDVDPHSCIKELKRFGQALGAEKIHHFVDSFESIGAKEKNMLKNILLGKSENHEISSFFSKDVISGELFRQLQKGMLKAQLKGVSGLLQPGPPDIGQQGIRTLGNVLMNQLSAAFARFAEINSKVSNIMQDPRFSSGMKALAATALRIAGQALMMELEAIYPQLAAMAQQGTGGAAAARQSAAPGGSTGGGMNFIQNLAKQLASHFPPGLVDALKVGMGEFPLSNMLRDIFSLPNVMDRLGSFFNQAVEPFGGWDGMAKGTLDWFENVGGNLGNILGKNLGRYIPKGLDITDPIGSMGKITKNIVDGFLFDKEHGLGLDRSYSGSWKSSGSWLKGWGDDGAKNIVKNFGIGYGQLGKTIWEGKLGGFDVGKLDEKASGDWGSAYIKGKTTFLEAGARAFGDFDPDKWSAMIGVEGRVLLAGADYQAGYSTPRVNLAGHEVGIDTNVNLHAAVGAEGRAMAEISLKDNPHLKIGGEAFAGARARLGGTAGLNIDGKDIGGVHGGVEGWAGIGAKADIDVGYKDGKFSFDFDLGAALGLGFEVDFGFDVNVGAVADVLEDIGSSLFSGMKDVGEFLGDAAKDVGEVFEDIGNGVEDVAEDVGGFVSKVGKGIAKGAEKVVDAVASGAKAVGHAISKGAKAVGHAISKIFSGW